MLKYGPKLVHLAEVSPYSRRTASVVHAGEFFWRIKNNNNNFFLRINSTLSEKLPVVSGVPQGSILGPLLFSIYVNDLPSAAKKCSSESYVDDTKLLLSFRINDSNTALTDLNEDLIRMRNWCFDNLLLLNPDKTKLMVYGSRQMLAKLPDFRLSLLGKELTPASSMKDVGVKFDPILSFDNHILSTVSSCKSSLCQINRAKHVFRKKPFNNCHQRLSI